MAHTVVDPTLSEGLSEVDFTEVDEIYLVIATGTLDSTDLIPSTSGVPRLKGDVNITDVELDNGNVLKIPGASADYGNYTVPMYASPFNEKLREIMDGAMPGRDNFGALFKGNAFYRDGSGFSFFTYLSSFGPAGEDDFRYEFDIAPFDVNPIGDLTATPPA